MTEGNPVARLVAALNRPKDAAALAMFRVALGLIIAISSARFLWFGWVDDFFVKPKFFFKYWGFSWITVPGRAGLYALFGALIVLGLLVSLGLFYRAAIVLLFFAFSYVQLLDVTNYLNHYYLVSLLLGLAAFMPLGRAYGLDAWRSRRGGLETLPGWMTYLLRFQVGCVYFFAGKAKFGSDWLLHAEPLNIWLSARTQTPLFGPLLGQRAIAFAFSWAGFLFDTTVVFFLLLPRTRRVAYAVVVLFHVITLLLFPIGMFPVIMVVSAMVFFSPSFPRAILERLGVKRLGWPRARIPTEHGAFVGRLNPLALGGIALYCAVQVGVPLKHHFYGDNVLWHEQGMRFSWKVMVREKNASVTYYVEDKRTGRTWYVRPRDYLDARQEREFAGQPDLILQLAHAIADEHRQRGLDVRVRAEVLASLNGRPPDLLLDPKVDLATVKDGLGLAGWITKAPTTPPAHLSGGCADRNAQQPEQPPRRAL